MAKQRRLRRAEREQHLQRVRQEQAALATKRLRRRELWRRLTLHELRRRSRGRLFARRSRGERAFIGVLVVLGLVVIWSAVPSLAWRVPLTLLFLLALPVLVIVAFDRRNA